MMLESFPQFILSLFMMQALQIQEPLNIVSCSASAISVMYGLGDFGAMLSRKNPADYPFSKTVWGTLSTCIDTLLRSFILAYWMTISKAYVIIVPFVFIFIMILVIFMKNKDLFVSFMFAIPSLGCSAFESNREIHKHFTFRPLSKGIFAAIVIAFSIYFGISASPKVFDTSDFPSNDTNYEPSPNITNDFKPSDCSTLCQGNRTDEEQEAFENYCNNLWETIDPEIHQTILIVIGILFFLSMLEWLLESYFDWMPYKKLYEGTDPGFIRGGLKRKENQQIELQDIENSIPVQDSVDLHSNPSLQNPDSDPNFIKAGSKDEENQQRELQESEYSTPLQDEEDSNADPIVQNSNT